MKKKAMIYFLLPVFFIAMVSCAWIQSPLDVLRPVPAEDYNRVIKPLTTTFLILFGGDIEEVEKLEVYRLVAEMDLQAEELGEVQVIPALLKMVSIFTDNDIPAGLELDPADYQMAIVSCEMIRNLYKENEDAKTIIDFIQSILIEKVTIQMI